MEATENTPKTIEVGFYHNPKPYYRIHGNGFAMMEIPLSSIWDFLEELDEDVLKDYTVSFWDKDGLGMKKMWSCDGEYFMENHKLVQLD